MADHGARLPDRPVLVGVTVGLALVETAIVSALGPVTALALAPQVSAPAPFAEFHDLRWIAVYTPSWVAFAGALAAFLVGRTAVTAVIVTLAWPATVPRPSCRALARRAFLATVIVAAVLVPWVMLTFATAVLSLSWTWIVAVPVVVMVSAIVHHAAVNDAWWRIWPRASTLGAILATFAGLSVIGAAIATGGAFARWPSAVLAGGLNAWCWLRVTHAVAGHVPDRVGLPFAFVALGAIVALVLGGTAAGFSIATAIESDRRPAPRVRSADDGLPVLVVRGFNSKWDGIARHWVRGPFRVQGFSYAGLTARGRPRAYDRAATHASVRTLARRMRVQVDALAAATGAPVGIVAESEGALVTLTYLLATPNAPVRAVVVLSPLVQPGRVSYPAPGRVGWGQAAGTALAGVAAAVNALGPVSVRSDTPLFRSIVAQAPVLQGLLQCRPPGVDELAVLPIDTAVAAPVPAGVSIPYVVRPAFHGGLIGDATTARLVRRVLRGRPVVTATRWRAAERVVQALASPWQVPSLAKSLEPAWRDHPDSDDCRAVRRALREYVAGDASARRTSTRVRR